MKKNLIVLGFIVFVVIGVFVASAQITRTPSAEGAAISILNLNNGDVVSSPVLVQFGLSGMGIAPAGIQFENTGHHHLLLDFDEATLDYNFPLASTENILHFGKGQTETSLELAPGEHTLQLLLGDFSHIAHEAPVMSEKITITVE
jgi:hypothetical protein